MDLPKNEKTFTFEATGDTIPKTYAGEFTVLCVPSMRDRRAIEIEKSRLTADLTNPTDSLVGLAVILANLRVRILNGPEWWSQSLGGLEIKDENVIVALYDSVMEQEDIWRNEVKQMAAPPQEEGDSLGNVPKESKQ